MFSRQQSHDGDVVAAARRRLAALAVRFEEDSEPAQSSEGATGRSPHGVHPAAPMVGGGPTPWPGTAPGARHLGARRTELGRWGVTGQQVTVVTLCLLLLVIVVAWWSMRSVPHADQVSLTSQRQLPGSPVNPAPPNPAVSTQSAATGVSVDDPSSADAGRLVVDVAGRVRHPGIVELPVGSRVVDALAAAGGARPGVPLTALNLAQLLVDGEQIVVGTHVPGVVGGGPSTPTSGSGASTGMPIERVQLNTATVEQLDTLPGVGPVTAQAILQWRSDNGPFASVDELLEVSGIGDATLDDIRPYVYV